METTVWHFVTWIVGLSVVILMAVIKGLSSKLNRTSDALAKHKTHVAEHYATKNDIKQLIEQLERHFDKSFIQLEKLIKNNDRDKAA